MERYRSLNRYLKSRFGEKVYKLALDGGFTCPTRDGTLDTRGCIFCAGGSGDFAIPAGEKIREAIETAKSLVAGKGAKKYIAYFQSYTGTYAPLSRLKKVYSEAIGHPDVVALSVATRPDCLKDETVRLLASLNRSKPVWIELGLQTIHAETAAYIRRGYDLSVYDDAVRRLHDAGIEVIVHMILGLPGETPESMRQTAEYIGQSGAEGIKFQLLHVLKGTDLAEEFAAGKVKVMTMEEYLEALSFCLESIPPEMVVHRLTGDGAKRSLIAPLWSADKKQVLREMNRFFEKNDVVQGRRWKTGI